VEKIPSFRPNPDLKLKTHARFALNGKNKAVAFDHGDGKVRSSPFTQPSRQKAKKPLSPATHRQKRLQQPRCSFYPNPSAILLKIATKEKSNATTYPRPLPAVKSFTRQWKSQESQDGRS
jgi:hypothetical protein